jgi:hypothetical protein
MLETTPRGASRRDLVSALDIAPSDWPAVREALEHTGQVVSIGRGPGLRHVHRRMYERQQGAADPPEPPPDGDPRVELVRALRAQKELDSAEAQRVTGLGPDAVRRLLLELVRAGRVTRAGHKRSTRYRWVD